MPYATRFLLIVALLAPVRAPAAQAEWKDVERVVAVGDVHGDFNALVTVLRSAGIIDEKNRWIAGKTHLVQTGDVPDRGPDTRKAMDLLMALEKGAAKAGGRVHALIGNHEAMNMYGDLRYTTAAEFASFADSNSARRREAFWEREQEGRKDAPPSDQERKKWEAEHPLGWFEHRFQFSPEGTYGKWIRSHNAVVKINDAIYLHGGISPRFVSVPIDEINTAVAAQLGDFKTLTENGPVLAPDGPLWFRGMAEDNGPAMAAHVDRVLAAYGVKRIVIGHTTTAGAVIPQFDGKVDLIDVGLSAAFGGRRACLLVEGPSLYAVHQGQRLELPAAGGALVAYLKKALALEPPGSALAKYAAQVETALAPR